MPSLNHDRAAAHGSMSSTSIPNTAHLKPREVSTALAITPILVITFFGICIFLLIVWYSYFRPRKSPTPAQPSRVNASSWPFQYLPDGCVRPPAEGIELMPTEGLDPAIGRLPYPNMGPWPGHLKSLPQQSTSTSPTTTLGTPRSSTPASGYPDPFILRFPLGTPPAPPPPPPPPPTMPAQPQPSTPTSTPTITDAPKILSISPSSPPPTILAQPSPSPRSSPPTIAPRLLPATPSASSSSPTILAAAQPRASLPRTVSVRGGDVELSTLSPDETTDLITTGRPLSTISEEGSTASSNCTKSKSLGELKKEKMWKGAMDEGGEGEGSKVKD